MSRLGKRPILLPQGVEVTRQNNEIRIKGPKGEEAYRLPKLVGLEVEGGFLRMKADYQNDSQARRMMGTARAILKNMVYGVSEGFERKLKLVGVGYRAVVQGGVVELSLGFSHPVREVIPEGVSAKMEDNTVLVLGGCNKGAVGQFAAYIRSLRPPEPYQGKGVMYVGEVIRRKAGKSGKK